MQLEVATSVASAGHARPSEDRLAVHRLEGGVAIVVADGAGGIAGGAEAASLVLEVVQTALISPTFDPFDARRWAHLLIDADHAIERDPATGETTCVVVTVTTQGRIVGASVGDSAALLVGSDRNIDDLTAKQRKKRLGSGCSLPAPFERPALNGTLAVTTDGIVAYVRPETIAHIVTAHEMLEWAAEALIDEARLPNGKLQDDAAVALIRSIRKREDRPCAMHSDHASRFERHAGSDVMDGQLTRTASTRKRRTPATFRRMTIATTTLWRPVGQAELDLIEQSGWRRFPPRLPEQPIFYPVCNEEYACQIASRWNTKDGRVGYVTRFEVRTEFLDSYDVQIVGSSVHAEYWIPAERLEAFNDWAASRS